MNKKLVIEGDPIVPIRVRNGVVHIESERPNQQAVIRIATKAGKATSLNLSFLKLVQTSRQTLSRGKIPRVPLRGLFVREGDPIVPIRVRNGVVHSESERPNQQAVMRIATKAGKANSARITPPTVAEIC